MRLVGIKANSALIGLGLLVSTIGVLGAGSDGPASLRYEVAAPLQLADDGTVYACYTFLMSYPPSGCGGIKLRGVDFSRLSGITSYGAAMVSPPMRLVGTWDGQVLSLTEDPRPVAKGPELPAPCEQDPNITSSSSTVPLQRWMGSDPEIEHRMGIWTLQATSCDERTLGLVVAVADTKTVAWLTARYGPVKVVGWLQPLPSGP